MNEARSHNQTIEIGLAMVADEFALKEIIDALDLCNNPMALVKVKRALSKREESWAEVERKKSDEFWESAKKEYPEHYQKMFGGQNSGHAT